MEAFNHLLHLKPERFERLCQYHPVVSKQEVADKSFLLIVEFVPNLFVQQAVNIVKLFFLKPTAQLTGHSFWVFRNCWRLYSSPTGRIQYTTSTA